MWVISTRHVIKQKVEKCTALQILQGENIVVRNLSFWFSLFFYNFFVIRNILYGL